MADALSHVLFDVYRAAIFNMSYGMDMVMDTKHADHFYMIAFTRQSASQEHGASRKWTAHQ